MVQVSPVGFVNAPKLAFVLLAAWINIAACPSASSSAPATPGIDTVCKNTACRVGGYEAVVSVDADQYLSNGMRHTCQR
jgi:hypothetical protein